MLSLLVSASFAQLPWTLLGAGITTICVHDKIVIAAQLDIYDKNVTVIYDCSDLPTTPCGIIEQLTVPSGANSTYAVPVSCERIDAGNFRILVSSVQNVTTSPIPPYVLTYYYYEMYVCTLSKIITTNGHDTIVMRSSVSCSYEWDPIPGTTDILVSYSNPHIAGYGQTTTHISLWLCGDILPTGCSLNTVIYPSIDFVRLVEELSMIRAFSNICILFIILYCTYQVLPKVLLI